MDMIYKYKIVGIMCMLLLISSCGDPGDNDLLPVGATVNISPAGTTWTIEADPPPSCTASPLHDSFHTISVQNDLDNTLVGVPVSLSVSLSQSNFTGMTLIELFVDENNNNIAESGELVSDNVSGAYDTVTDEDTGTVKIIVRMNLSCLYGGKLTVQAGTISGEAEFSVSAGT